MKILYCKTFGIGNAVLSISALKALRNLYFRHDDEIDLLIGDTKDDFGAREVFEKFKNYWDFPGKIYIGCGAPINKIYDIAIESIPYDGRWINGVHYRAKEVLDGRTRPDPTTTGLSSWEKHEVLYQLDIVRELKKRDLVFDDGQDVKLYDCRFFNEKPVWAENVVNNMIYLGVGYKKTKDYMVKGLSPEFLSEVILKLVEQNKKLKFITTGDQKDLEYTIAPVSQLLAKAGHRDKLMYAGSDLKQSFSVINSCRMYIGTDSGSMHVAASCGLPCVVVFNMQYSSIKNHPWKTVYKALEGWENPVTAQDMVDATLEILDVV